MTLWDVNHLAHIPNFIPGTYRFSAEHPTKVIETHSMPWITGETWRNETRWFTWQGGFHDITSQILPYQQLDMSKEPHRIFYVIILSRPEKIQGKQYQHTIGNLMCLQHREFHDFPLPHCPIIGVKNMELYEEYGAPARAEREELYPKLSGSKVSNPHQRTRD